jgi:hypothetical protein
MTAPLASVVVPVTGVTPPESVDRSTIWLPPVTAV